MELRLFNLSGMELRLLVMPRGAYRRELLAKEGEGRVYAVIAGRLSVQTCDQNRPQRTMLVEPGSPLLLDTPGNYHVTADRNSIGVRGERRV